MRAKEIPEDASRSSSTVVFFWVSYEFTYENFVPMEIQTDPSRKSKRILVVDDEAGVRKTFGLLLPPPKFDTMHAANGTVAVGLAKEHRFDVAIVDATMPGINGVETCNLLRRIQPGIKLILTSGVMCLLGGDVSQMLEMTGAEYFLPKPFTIETLKELADRLFKSH